MKMRLSEQQKLLLLAEKAELEQKIAPFVKRINGIDELLKKEQKKDNRGDWNRKALDSLKMVGQPMTTEEVLYYIFYGRENEIVDTEIKRSYMLKVSLALIRLCKKGTLFSRNVHGYRGKIYGFNEWLYNRNFAQVIENKQREISKEKCPYISLHV
jgi:hypothetical protein